MMESIPFVIGAASLLLGSFVAFPILAFNMHILLSTPQSLLASVFSPYYIEKMTLDIGSSLAFSAILVAAILIGALILGKEMKGMGLPIIGVLTACTALSGIAICGFLLDSINQAMSSKSYIDMYALFIRNNELEMQKLLASQEALIAGIVVCSIIILTLIGISFIPEKLTYERV